MIQWMIGSALLAGFTISLGKMIQQNIQRISYHSRGFQKVTQSLVQKPRFSLLVRFQQQNRRRSYGEWGKRIYFDFTSDYRKK